MSSWRPGDARAAAATTATARRRTTTRRSATTTAAAARGRASAGRPGRYEDRGPPRGGRATDGAGQATDVRATTGRRAEEATRAAATSTRRGADQPPEGLVRGRRASASPESRTHESTHRRLRSEGSSCGNQNLGPLVLNRRGPPRHRRDTCSMAWRYWFLTARPSRSAASPEK